MDKTQIQHYCRRYFQATGCPILRDEPGFLQVELPREIDKELMDRPYYWMWVEAIGQDVPPTVLNLVFDSETEIAGVERTELVALGSYRLEKIFQSAARRGQFVCQYQTATPSNRRVPFLLTNVKISYLADRRRDELRSFGVNLRNNQVIPDLYEAVRDLPMSCQLPEHYREQLKQTGLLVASLQTGWQRIKNTILEEIRNSDHTWAELAKEQLAQEINQLETYYESLILENEEKMDLYSAERELRVAELKWRCQPRIQVQPLHFALLYLDPTQFTAAPVRT
ncbi:YqhG family protein [Effusibacillus pohliae]|uniref:YqhG family protein n=1 Tax=Effusibacillus pohliae TaxID=232270 RepID=UPI00035F6A3A|nr:YqhG family protein [Effusibacillus pohliae]